MWWNLSSDRFSSHFSCGETSPQDNGKTSPNVIYGKMSPHDRYFLHKHRLWCLWQISGMIYWCQKQDLLKRLVGWFRPRSFTRSQYWFVICKLKACWTGLERKPKLVWQVALKASEWPLGSFCLMLVGCISHLYHTFIFLNRETSMLSKTVFILLMLFPSHRNQVCHRPEVHDNFLF